MTIVLVIAAAAATLAVFGVQNVQLYGHFRESEDDVKKLSEEKEAVSTALVRAHLDLDDERDEVCDLREQLRRVISERDKAIRDGGKAAVAAMKAAVRERDEWIEALRAWQVMATVGMWVGTTRALPPAERKAIEPPQPLPSGDFLVEDERLILPADLDDDDDDPFEDYEFLQLPARAEVT